MGVSVFLILSLTTTMTSYVLDKVDIMKPVSNYSTEYNNKYNRQLWDSATRSHYFQLSKDRRTRMLQAAKHAPIHWDHSKDGESDDIQSISSEYLPKCCCQDQNSSKQLTDRKVGVKRPEPPSRIKSAWCGKPSRSQSQSSDFVVLDIREADNHNGRDSSLSLKRSSNQRSPTPASACEDDRKRLRKPGSGSRSDTRASSICRPKSASSCRLSGHKDYSRPPSRTSDIIPSTGRSRPNTGGTGSSYGTSRPSTSDTFHSSASRKYTKLPISSSDVQVRTGSKMCKKGVTTKQAFAPFALYGGESETARSHELRDHRVKNAAKGMGIGFQKVGSSELKKEDVDATDLPRDIRLWVTEYQGNFKHFNPIK
ncbi:uncharacterized protein LOC134811150 [Bolinopsis microptera]|uniref:uncharacterized protein LOC134811150 n=1 Tax=Bolinopsis microptera TaxID=2820187 RepID=UPI00307A268D